MTRAETRSGPARYDSPSAHTGPQRAQRGHAATRKPLRRSHTSQRLRILPPVKPNGRSGRGAPSENTPTREMDPPDSASM